MTVKIKIMRKLSSLICIVFMIINTFAQEGGEVIWSEDFGSGLPEGWADVDLSYENMYWQWYESDVIGCYTWIPFNEINSESPQNGYMVMNADGYNTFPWNTHHSQGGVVVGHIPVNCYIQSIPINLTGYDDVMLEFYQHVRIFSNFTTSVFATFDLNNENPDLIHWQEWNTSEDLNSNEAKEGFYHAHISELAGTQDSVYIRFHAHDNTHYYWIIDDLKIYEPFDIDLLLEKIWIYSEWKENAPENSPLVSGFQQHGGGYMKYPKNELKSFVGCEAVVKNIGRSDQTDLELSLNIYWKSLSEAIDSNLVFTAESDLISLGSMEYDTLSIDFEYTPDEYGYYLIYMDINSELVDENPANNIIKKVIYCNDSAYSRVSQKINKSMNLRNGYYGEFDGDRIGTVFNLKSESEVVGMRWFFANHPEQSWNNIEMYAMFAKLFKYDTIIDNWDTLPWIHTILNQMGQTMFIKKETGQELIM